MILGGMALTGILWLIGFCMLVAAGLFLMKHYRFQIRVCKYRVPIAGLSPALTGFTILQLSDLHSKRFGPGQQRLLKMIREQTFDIIALTGDFVDKFNYDPAPVFELVRDLKGLPIFFVPGNHEWRKDFFHREALADTGIRLLQNDAVRIEKGGLPLWVLGVDDPHTGRDDLEKALAQVDGSGPKILLAHSPNIFPLAETRGIDLVLSGHTHGGQVRIPFLGALMVPGQGFFPRWDYGHYRRGQAHLVISGGLGESDLPVRLNLRPEMVLIELVPK